MARRRIIREISVAETRYAAIGEDGRAVSLLVMRPWEAPRLLAGSVHDARVRALAISEGGAFVAVRGWPDAFLRLSPGHGLTEGAAIRVRTIAEARDGKLARVETAAPGETGLQLIDAWRADLPAFEDAEGVDVPAGDPGIESAFEEAMSPHVTLPGGGRLTIERTRALTAADIDTAGRSGRGSAAARARAVNVAAATELARQLNLRQAGGLCVLDCVAPLTRESSRAVREAFLAAHTALSRRSVRVLAPSDLGLMELSLAWARKPLAEHYVDAQGRDRDEAVAIAGLRRLERAASLAPMARLTLRLPSAAHDWIRKATVDFEAALVARFGARLQLLPGHDDQPEVHPTP